MSRTRLRSVALALAVATQLALPIAAHAEALAIARPSLADPAAAKSGVVFFLAAGVPTGMVAVGTAHTFENEDFGAVGEIVFRTPASNVRLASSRGFATPPGQPFHPNGTLRGDYLVFALSESPRSVGALEVERAVRLRAGQRIRVLGPSPDAGRDQTEILGTLATANAERIEIDLDAAPNLAGWGGAPVLLAETGRVVGIVQAVVPGDGKPRILASPLDDLLVALAAPLDDGTGRPFAAFAAKKAATPDATEIAIADEAPDTGRPLIQPTAGLATQLELAIEYPPDGSNIEPTICGAFVAGHAQAIQGRRRSFDVVLVLDTSSSTGDPAGTDVNGNGVVGESRMGGLGSVFGATISDRGDTILAAEIAAARQILLGLDPRSTRVGLIAFAGDAPGTTGNYALRKPAYTVEALTNEYERIERSLDDLLQTRPEGQTHMSAGVDQATLELLGLRGAYSKTDPESEKIVFFFTDGQPTLPYGPDAEADNVRAVLRAANRANRGGVRIHSFAIGPEALEGPIAAVEMASRTRGFFTPVRDPGDLVDVVEDVSFANLEAVRLEHADTGREAEPFRITADGSFAGFVALEQGRNRVRVRATAEDGTSGEREIALLRAEGGADAVAEPALPPGLLVQRNRLLEDCLLLARERRLQQERERNEEIRRALRLEIERERQRARQRAAEQRKTLELEAVDE